MPDLTANEYINLTSSPDDMDPLLNPDLPIPSLLPSNINPTSLSAEPGIGDTMQASSYTGPLSSITDGELNELILWLRSHYCQAGITMLDGMLRRLGHHIQREWIRQCLTHIDPVQWVFKCICIRRHVYSVPGPNSLWHHDGQHGMDTLILYSVYSDIETGLICWGIVIHGFIDGYSRLITALQASDNNCGQTVLTLFFLAARLFGVPSQIRGDHGVENILLAAWMEANRGEWQGSYIWGRYMSTNNFA